MNFVLDASVALAWCFEDEAHAESIAVLDGLRSGEAVVAHHWTLEVANGLVSAERRERLTADEATRFARLLLALPIAVDPVTRGTALTETRRLARTHRLTSYDAAYLELAVRLGVPLATLDAPLRTAASAEGIELMLEVPPSL
jgi:predicted nucleic acid-binding protein